jgi:microcystin-dependent protein
VKNVLPSVFLGGGLTMKKLGLVVLAICVSLPLLAQAGVPSGTVVAYAGKPDRVPAGWLLCDGRAVGRHAYPKLFAVIGTIYGDDGVTKFRLPDLRGRVVVGDGAGPGLTPRPLGEKAGEETHTLTVGEMPSHAHAELFDDHIGAAGGNNAPDANGGGVQLGTTGPAGGGAAHNNMQPYFVLTYIIKI